MRHSKKITLTAIIAMLGSALVASPAHAAPPPVFVNCSVDGSFSYQEYDPGTGVIVEVQSSPGCEGTATIPANVTSIASYAFMMLPNLTSVEFQAGSALTLIGSGAFMDSSNLTSITIPSSVTTIRSSAFSGTGLTSVTFDGNEPGVVEGSGPGTAAFERAGLNPVGYIGAFADGFVGDPTWQGLTIVRADATPAPAPAPYSGPLPTNYSDRTPAVGDEVVVSGLRLSSITSCTIDGVTAAMSNQSADRFTIVIPAGLEPGLKDLVITSSAGTLNVQDAITVSAAAEDASESSSGVSAKGWTKKLTDSSAKIYAKDVVGAGKVQIFFNGKEIAWVRATSESDSKLRTANGAHYLVRTVELVKGQKNTLEVHVDGIKIKRVAYSY